MISIEILPVALLSKANSAYQCHHSPILKKKKDQVGDSPMMLDQTQETNPSQSTVQLSRGKTRGLFSSDNSRLCLPK
jgi:hypothetical protein